MKKNSVSEFELEKEDFKIKLKRTPTADPLLPSLTKKPFVTRALPFPCHRSTSGSLGVSCSRHRRSSGEQEIKSPMIGTFYRSPSPEAGPYVEVGMEVNPETVVCIIEAMKVMNEIKAEARGVITQVSDRERQAGRIRPAAVQDSAELIR